MFGYCHVLVPYLLANAIIKQILPLHDIQEIYYLRSNWIHSNFPKQPLGKHRTFLFTNGTMIFIVINTGQIFGFILLKLMPQLVLRIYLVLKNI